MNSCWGLSWRRRSRKIEINGREVTLKDIDSKDTAVLVSAEELFSKEGILMNSEVQIFFLLINRFLINKSRVFN